MPLSYSTYNVSSMSDDEPDLELLELLRQSLGINKQPEGELSIDTGVLRDAEFIYNNAVDVSIDMWSTKGAAKKLWKIMQERNWSAKAWSQHELHPSSAEGFDDTALLNFVFTMDLLNFCFWSELDSQQRFQIEYQGKRWTGYMSLVAALRRALDERIPITTPRFWRSAACDDELIKHVFRSATAEQMPLLDDRIAILRQAAEVLKAYDDVSDDKLTVAQGSEAAIEPQAEQSALAEDRRSTPSQAISPPTIAGVGDVGQDGVGDTNNKEQPTVEADAKEGAQLGTNDKGCSLDSAASFQDANPDRSVERFIAKADCSAGKLVNLLVKEIPSFDDACRYESRRVRLLKRAQIFVADLYGAFGGERLGNFHDISHLTMFADYRVPQVLQGLGILNYCPALEAHIRRGDLLPSQSSWEVQLRGCSIYATELLRREIIRLDESARSVNAVLIDFLLYDLAKERELQSIEGSMPHHRTRSTNY